MQDPKSDVEERSDDREDHHPEPASTLEGDFKKRFLRLVPVVIAEWPSVSEDELRGTDGDLDRALTLLSRETDRTRTLLRRQLEELMLFEEKSRRQARPRGRPWSNYQRSLRELDLEDLLSGVRRLETHARREARKVSDQVVPIAEREVRLRPLTSLLFALGLGLILGLLAGGRRRA